MNGRRNLKRKGADFERRVKSFLEKRGYFVVRSAGSKGVADLVALSKNEKLLVTCKKRNYLSGNEINSLVKKAAEIDGKPIFAYEEGGKIKIKELTLKDSEG